MCVRCTTAQSTRHILGILESEFGVSSQLDSTLFIFESCTDSASRQAFRGFHRHFGRITFGDPLQALRSRNSGRECVVIFVYNLICQTS